MLFSGLPGRRKLVITPLQRPQKSLASQMWVGSGVHKVSMKTPTSLSHLFSRGPDRWSMRLKSGVTYKGNMQILYVVCLQVTCEMELLWQHTFKERHRTSRQDCVHHPEANTCFVSGSVLSSANATVNKRHSTCPHDAYSLAIQQTLMKGSPKFYNVYYQQNECYEFPELWYSLGNQGKLPRENASLVVIWRMNWRKQDEDKEWEKECILDKGKEKNKGFMMIGS